MKQLEVGLWKGYYGDGHEFLDELELNWNFLKNSLIFFEQLWLGLWSSLFLWGSDAVWHFNKRKKMHQNFVTESEGGLKVLFFCMTSFMNGPYEILSFLQTKPGPKYHTSHNFIKNPSRNPKHISTTPTTGKIYKTVNFICTNKFIPLHLIIWNTECSSSLHTFTLQHLVTFIRYNSRILCKKCDYKITFSSAPKSFPLFKLSISTTCYLTKFIIWIKYDSKPSYVFNLHLQLCNVCMCALGFCTCRMRVNIKIIRSTI